MKRRPSTQDITWFLDLNDRKQLDLNPSYQRRSVWTPKDKKFFLDTIFRNYPSPAVFVHKSVSDRGQATYHVVDGKQRLQTILDFINDKIKIDEDFGDVRVDNKKWSEIVDPEIRQSFWNYTLSVEQIDFVDVNGESSIVKDVFDRLNRNSKKLTSQELRHAKYEGWFNNFAEEQTSTEQAEYWKKFKVSTVGRNKRMLDTQSVSELMMIVIENNIRGFDQDVIDQFYADYDDIFNPDAENSFDEQDFYRRFSRVKDFISEIDKVNGCVVSFANSFSNFYTLWSVVSIYYDCLASKEEFALAYYDFMCEVKSHSDSSDDNPSDVAQYTKATKGATTDLKPRKARLVALLNHLGIPYEVV